MRGRDEPARPELVTDPAEVERLLGVIAEKNPRAARFIPVPCRPDGRLDPDALDAALLHGFCIVRWHQTGKDDVDEPFRTAAVSVAGRKRSSSQREQTWQRPRDQAATA